MTAMEDPPIDLALALRRVDGDPDLLEEVVRIFQDDLPERMRQLRAALERGDLPETARSAHSLRGSLGILGAEPGRILGEELEALSAAGRSVEAASTYRTFEREVARVSAFFSSPEWSLRTPR
jgi:HPt (histidine-containing phosphotransfer) domain-containing protein